MLLEVFVNREKSTFTGIASEVQHIKAKLSILKYSTLFIIDYPSENKNFLNTNDFSSNWNNRVEMKPDCKLIFSKVKSNLSEDSNCSEDDYRLCPVDEDISFCSMLNVTAVRNILD